MGGASAFENQKLRRRSLQAAVTGSGGPVLVLPDNAKLERVERAVLGWDASSEARRAARDLIDVADPGAVIDVVCRSEEHTSELQSLMRLSYAVFLLKTKTNKT